MSQEIKRIRNNKCTKTIIKLLFNSYKKTNNYEFLKQGNLLLWKYFDVYIDLEISKSCDSCNKINLNEKFFSFIIKNDDIYKPISRCFKCTRKELNFLLK